MTPLLLAHPIFAWLMPLTLLPVVFHLFFRIRRKAMPFSTFMFFHRIDPRLSAWHRLREWLVLLLRMLVIALLLMALARPVWMAGGAGARVAAVLVIDNSGSMSAPAADGATRLDKALEGADATLGSLGPGDSAAVVLLADDPTVPLPQTLTADRAALRSALRHITPTEATGSPGPAFDRAFALLEASPAGRREVHVFTDLQEADWGRGTTTPRAGAAGAGTQFHRIRPAREEQPNVSVLEVALPQKKLVAGRPVPALVRLANPGGLDADVRVNWEDDAGNRGVQPVGVPRHEERTCRFVLNPPDAGFHRLKVWVEGDRFEADNRAALAFRCAPRDRVLFIGATNEFGFLPAAISPSADGALSGLIPAFVGAAQAAAAVPAPVPALAVVTWSALSDTAGLERGLKAYVTAGGNLLVLPAPYATGAPAGAPDWIGTAADAREIHTNGLPVLVFHKTARVFDDLRDDRGDVRLRNVRAFRFLPLRPRQGTEAWLGLDDGRALLTAAPLGQGMVFAVGFAFDPDWSNLPLKPGFLAVAQGLAFAGRKEEPLPMLTAGERPALTATNGTVRLQTIDGPALTWEGPAAALPALSRSGIYAIGSGSNVTWVSVKSSHREGLPAVLESQQVPAAEGLAYTVDTYSDAASLVDRIKRQRKGLDLYVPLLAACLLALLAEGWLANRPPRAPDRKAGG